MSTNTAIQWTTHSFNPWWGCVKIAQGCKNCYAEGVASRFAGRRVWGPNSERRIASEKVWNDPFRWNAAAERSGERARVFCLSMGDVLEDHPALVEPRKRLVGIIERTPFLDWQLLTKRPENAAMFGWGDHWPTNVWFGASAANDAEAQVASAHLSLLPYPLIRFLSLEPLVGNIDVVLCGIEWVIVGGESGPGARHCSAAWIRRIVNDCRVAAVPVFVKQLGSNSDIPCVDTKGGDWNEWPHDMRVREFPR